MNLQLKDKVIIVSGGSSGIGAAICAALTREGAIANSIDRNLGDAFTLQAELTDPQACRSAVESIANRFGRIDGLVNNAGMNDNVGLENGSYADFLRSLERNALHYYTLLQAALPWMKACHGSVVNIISKVAETGQGGTSGYAAANGMRMELTRAWAQELRAYAIRVNGVMAAECLTPGYAEWIGRFEHPEQLLQTIGSKIPLGNRMTSVQEIAETVIYLLSSRASALNGELLYVDGGYVHLDRALNGRNKGGLQ
jgi:L-fucose dehydrogenase